ncbi:MAG: hypothetical protein ACKV2Q_35200 [Planctomycetaceae bacterium]
MPNDPQFVMLARKDLLDALHVLVRLPSESTNLRASRQHGQLLTTSL